MANAHGPARPKLETWFHETVSGERRGIAASLSRGLLRGCAVAYAVGLAGRDAAYALHLVPRRRVAARVISIGNITLGGTGKTPAVIHVARHFRDRGERVAVLVRGHGGRKLAGVNVVHDGVDRLLGVDDVGDEAVLLAERLADVPVLAGKDRRLTAKVAVETFEASVLVLDDGFQYRRLVATDQIVLLDATRPFGTGRLFPAGTLRDPVGYLARADQIWLTRTDHPGAVASAELHRRVSELAPDVPIFSTRHEPTRLTVFPSGAALPLDRLRGATVVSMAGIGNPEALDATLAGLGVVRLVREPFPDHYRYTQEDIAGVLRRAAERGCEAVVTTEKDAVRLSLWPAGGPELWVLGIDLVFDGPAPQW